MTRLSERQWGTLGEWPLFTRAQIRLTHAIPTLESRGCWLSLARALLNERPGLFERGREVPLHQKGLGEGFSFPAAQDTYLAGSPVENNLHDRAAGEVRI